MDILVDASVIMAVILNEPNKNNVIKLTKNAALLSTEILSFEVGNALANLFKRRKITEDQLFEAYKDFTSISIRSVKVNIEKALKIACNHKIYAYDAYYLEAASRLKLPLITFDILMQQVGSNLKINILGEPVGGEKKK